jgi:hypothetical protein
MINGVYYQITVTKDDVHFFSTNTSDYQYTNTQIRELRTIFATKFPESEGYAIEITSIRATPNTDSLVGIVPN